MLYSFKIGELSNDINTQAGSAYFESVAHGARRALAADEVASEQAFAACEYLDLVDAGSIKMERALYRQCVALVTEYLTSAEKPEADELAGRSWAANTLVEVMATLWAKGQVCELHSVRQAA